MRKLLAAVFCILVVTAYTILTRELLDWKNLGGDIPAGLLTFSLVLIWMFITKDKKSSEKTSGVKKTSEKSETTSPINENNSQDKVEKQPVGLEFEESSRASSSYETASKMINDWEKTKEGSDTGIRPYVFHPPTMYQFSFSFGEKDLYYTSYVVCIHEK